VAPADEIPTYDRLKAAPRGTVAPSPPPPPAPPPPPGIPTWTPSASIRSLSPWFASKPAGPGSPAQTSRESWMKSVPFAPLGAAKEL